MWQQMWMSSLVLMLILTDCFNKQTKETLIAISYFGMLIAKQEHARLNDVLSVCSCSW